MIKIRLQRHGSRHTPFYRMVVAPSFARRDGKFIEVLGTYNPVAHNRSSELELKLERIDHWIGQGSQPTDTARSLIRQGRLRQEKTTDSENKKPFSPIPKDNKGLSVVVEKKVTESLSESQPTEFVEDSGPSTRKSPKVSENDGDVSSGIENAVTSETKENPVEEISDDQLSSTVLESKSKGTSKDLDSTSFANNEENEDIPQIVQLQESKPEQSSPEVLSEDVGKEIHRDGLYVKDDSQDKKESSLEEATDENPKDS